MIVLFYLTCDFDYYFDLINNQSIIPSTDVIQLTLKMTTAQVVETSVTVNNDSPIQDYVHPDDQTQPFDMTPGFKPFTIIRLQSDQIPSTAFIPCSLSLFSVCKHVTRRP